jgi:SAM-dependent methyltransferase
VASEPVRSGAGDDRRPLALVDTACVLCGSSEARVRASGTDFEYETSEQTFHFVACVRCGHQYLRPRPAASELDVIYPSNYYSFVGTTNALVARLQRVWEGGKVRLYREWIGDGPRRILDVGCGDGRFLALLRDFGHPEWQLVGLEFDPAAIERCRERGFEAHAERVEDFADREGERGRYDGVVMLQLIEHVEDPALLTERVADLLRPGGVFIIETPNPGGLDYRMFAGRWWGHYHFPRHWNLFSTEALVRMLEARGFEVVRSEYLISTSSWIISHHNYFKDRGWPRFVWRFFSYQNPLLLALAVAIDTVRIRLGHETSNQRVIARRRGARGG